MTFSTENPLKNWSKQQQPPLYLQNSKRAFLSAGSCFQYSQLQLDKFSQPEINFFYNWNIFTVALLWIHRMISCTCHMQWNSITCITAVLSRSTNRESSLSRSTAESNRSRILSITEETGTPWCSKVATCKRTLDDSRKWHSSVSWPTCRLQ